MDNKKILWVVNQFASLPKYSFGAGERYFYLSEPLSKGGYKVRVFSGAFNHLFKNLPETSGVYTDEKISYGIFTWVRLKKYRPQDYVWRTLSWFEFTFKLFKYSKTEEMPDTILVSSMSLVPVLFGVWLKKKYGAKFILEIRDIWPKTLIEIGGYSKRHPLSIVLEKIELLGYKHADHVISVLPGMKRHLEESGFIDKPFTWIPNGISESLECGDDSIHACLTLNKLKFNILYAGTIGNANAMEYFIQAAALLKNEPGIHFNIIGDGPLKEDLQWQAQGLNNVTFYPKVFKADLQAILNQANVCYIGWHNQPLYSYGVGANKYNDYMLAKKPILSSSNIVNDPVIMANSGLNVPAAAPKQIVDGIIKMQKMNRDELNILGENGYKFLRENHTYEVIGNKLLKVLDGQANGIN